MGIYFLVLGTETFMIDALEILENRFARVRKIIQDLSNTVKISTLNIQSIDT